MTYVVTETCIRCKYTDCIELAKQWKPIIEKKQALPDADEWAQAKDKRGELDRG